MEFLDRFTPTDRERLLAAGRVQRLAEGEYLIRRGERGGDVFFVEEGRFEVVDGSTQPEVVLGNVGPGKVLGEFSFVDAAPRSADVRAVVDAAVRVWEPASMLALFEAEPAFGAAFYRALATATVARMRTLSSAAVSGGLGGASGARRAGGDDAAEARAIAHQVQSVWLEADAALRRDPDDAAARRAVDDGFERLVARASQWLRGFPEPEAAATAGEELSRDLRPYLVRAALAELTLDPPSRRSGDPRLVAHVLLDRARGDGALGELLDARLLALPTCAALRQRTEVAARTVAAGLPGGRPAVVMMVNATCGALLARLLPELAREGATVRAIDGSREALAFLDAGLSVRPPSVTLKLVQEDLAALALGRSSSRYEAADFVIVDGLLDYLPDRLAAALLAWVRGHLAPNGVVVVTGLGPSPDAEVFDHVLDWPMVRRSAGEVRTLLEGCALRARVVAGHGAEGPPAVVVEGLRVAEPDGPDAVG